MPFSPESIRVEFAAIGTARERDERDAVIRAEPGQESVGGGAGHLQREAPHTAAGVDDQGEVQGRRARRGRGASP